MLDLLVRHSDPPRPLEVHALVHKAALCRAVVSRDEDRDGVVNPHHHGVDHGGDPVGLVCQVHILHEWAGCGGPNIVPCGIPSSCSSKLRCKGPNGTVYL